MQIEIGKTYISRRGELVRVTGPSGDPKWPFCILVLSGRYRATRGLIRADGGAQTIRGKRVNHDSDLVREAV